MNRIIKINLVILLSLTLFSCNRREFIRTYDYLKELGIKSGISLEEDDESVFSSLIEFGVIDEIDKSFLEKNLTYKCMLDSLSCFTDDLRLKLNYKDEDYVYKEDALKSIDKLLEVINHKRFDTHEEHIYKENVKEKIAEANIGDIYYDEDSKTFKKINSDLSITDASFEEVFEELKISSSEELDLDNCEIVEDGSVSEEEYIDEDYTLLAAKKNVIEKEGFRISYKVVSGVIEFRVSNNKDNYNKYVDFKLSGIRPSYKWDYESGNIKEAYLKLDYNLSCELGVSKEKRNYYNVDLKNMDTSSVFSALSSALVKKTKDTETKIHICTIKTPIPAFPLVSFDIDIFVRINITGKIDIVATMSNTNGFEIINNKFRLINDGTKDIDFNVEASARAVCGCDFALSCACQKLMNIEVAGGVKASCKTTLHLYDSDGNMETKTMDIVYSDVNDVSDDNLKVCADVSLNWILDIDLNTKGSLLYKLGLSRSKEILNSKDQILGNMTHIENGHFVKSCTRKAKKYVNSEINKIDVNKIILETYSKAININESYTIPIKLLPDGYSNNDLIVEASDNSIVLIDGLNISAIKTGSTKITIKTKDQKYSAYINILVSTGK